MELFTNLNNTEIEHIWIRKRAKMQTAYLTVRIQNTTQYITVERGWWFSAHEKWKYLSLPYLDIEVNRRLFNNGERARTIYSALNKIPGLFASVNRPKSDHPDGYISATGIQELAFQHVEDRDVITPYAAFPLFLASFDHGLVWYAHMLNGSKMQGPYGSTESFNFTNQAICNLVTWDAKTTTVVAILGGVSSIVKEAMIKGGIYDKFYKRVNTEWSAAYPNITGESLPFLLPSMELSKHREDFTTVNYLLHLTEL